MSTDFIGTVHCGREPDMRRSSAFLWYRLVAACLCLGFLVGSGCHSIGPSTIKRDRLHYATVVADSWKEQLLLNIVKTRYGDAPAFLELTSVVSGYTVEGRVSAGFEWEPDWPEDVVSLGASRTFTDRPTISYSPMTGDRYAHSLMSPVPLDTLMFEIQGGVPAKHILALTLQSFEGHRNMGVYAGQFSPADPKFVRLLQLLHTLQQTNAIEAEIVRQGDQSEAWLQFHPGDPSMTAQGEQMTELKTLLGVPVELDRARIVYGTMALEPELIGMRTRSLMQILSTLGAGVQIHQEHLSTGGVVPVDASQTLRGFTVHSGRERPDDVFVAVPYEGLWFWIDQWDLASKVTLSSITVLFNFLESDSTTTSPVLTISTN